MEDCFKINVEIEKFKLFPKILEYESMVDELSDFSCCFESGKIYGLVGECGMGGWGISYLLCGRDAAQGCKIYMNGNLCSQEELKKIGWYVGEGIERVSHFFKEKSVIKQIRYGLKETKICDEEEIIKRFALTKERLGCKVSQLSGERWRASVAIGYVRGCKVFCLPWHNTWNMNNRITSGRLDIYADILRGMGKTVIIPVGREEALYGMADEVIFMDNEHF